MFFLFPLVLFYTLCLIKMIDLFFIVFYNDINNNIVLFLNNLSKMNKLNDTIKTRHTKTTCSQTHTTYHICLSLFLYPLG